MTEENRFTIFRIPFLLLSFLSLGFEFLPSKYILFKNTHRIFSMAVSHAATKHLSYIKNFFVEAFWMKGELFLLASCAAVEPCWSHSSACTTSPHSSPMPVLLGIWEASMLLAAAVLTQGAKGAPWAKTLQLDWKGELNTWKSKQNKL